ncbi:peptidoglycan-binding domain-containing protein [Streptacidiphilus melanogenes]|uniref:peptidoglycan-binding domain-containing protein n=1 Tax=Streptacidiphilus melanogenes TaxID=411235 RepID=UPI0007C6BBD0|nr:peptidoglycan-binding domain-containing protein [Streptacidiphilus melanogenes]
MTVKSRMTTAATAAAVAVATLGLGLGTATGAHAAAPYDNNCAYYSTSEPMLGYGSAGAPVKALQCQLNMTVRGVNLDVDGIFGQNTYNAVKKFQGCDHLAVDGVVGPNTWGQLDSWSDIDTSANYVC